MAAQDISAAEELGFDTCITHFYPKQAVWLTAEEQRCNAFLELILTGVTHPMAYRRDGITSAHKRKPDDMWAFIQSTEDRSLHSCEFRAGESSMGVKWIDREDHLQEWHDALASAKFPSGVIVAPREELCMYGADYRSPLKVDWPYLSEATWLVLRGSVSTPSYHMYDNHVCDV
jgi:hypothetical protein